MGKSVGEILQEMITMPNVQWPEVWQAIVETLYMTVVSTIFAFIFGLILGILLFLSLRVIRKWQEFFIQSFHLS